MDGWMREIKEGKDFLYKTPTEKYYFIIKNRRKDDLCIIKNR